MSQRLATDGLRWTIVSGVTAACRDAPPKSVARGAREQENAAPEVAGPWVPPVGGRA